VGLSYFSWGWYYRVNMKKIKKTQILKNIFFAFLLVLFPAMLNAQMVSAANSYLTYTAKLTTSAGAPVITAQTVRLSMWNSADFIPADLDVNGNILLAAPAFLGWQETYTVTPNSEGIFTLRLGSLMPLPILNPTIHKFLEVDVKPSAAANTAFEVLDPDGNLANTSDRKPLDSVPYSYDSQTVNNLSPNNAPNNIPVLDAAGKLFFGVLPDGVNANIFTLDQDNNAPGNVITLQFGSVLGKFLQWNDLQQKFKLSDSLEVNGNLNFTGTRNITNAIIDGGVNTIQNISINSIVPYAQEMKFIPTYKGVVLEPDGANNVGVLKVENDSAVPGKPNYYIWTSNVGTLQDLDIVLKFQLPINFVAFSANPLALTYKTADNVVVNNSLDVTMTDSLDANIVLNGASSLVTNGNWASTEITFNGIPTFTPGSTVELRMKLSTLATKFVQAGDITLRYVGR